MPLPLALPLLPSCCRMRCIAAAACCCPRRRRCAVAHAAAHPTFGTPRPRLATRQVYQSPLHTASVNGLAWAPYELGLALAAASSDGSLSVLTYQPDGTWFAEKVLCFEQSDAECGWLGGVCSPTSPAAPGLPGRRAAAGLC